MSNKLASYPLITDSDRLHYWSIYLWTSSIVLINLPIYLVYIIYASVVSLIYLRVNYSATTEKKDHLIESLSGDDDFDGNAHHHHRDNTSGSFMGYDNKKDGSNTISGVYSKASNRSNSYKRIKCPSVSTVRSAFTTLSIVSFIIILSSSWLSSSTSSPSSLSSHQLSSPRSTSSALSSSVAPSFIIILYLTAT